MRGGADVSTISRNAAGVVLLAAALAVSSPGPAAALTDDRILNDAVSVLNRMESIAEQGRVCAQATDADPVVAQAFADFARRSARWSVMTLSVMQMRGGVDQALVSASREAMLAQTRATLAAKPDLAADCREVARIITEAELDIAGLMKDETLRISGARDGNLPPLDLANSPAVADATALRQMFMNREATLKACGAATGDVAGYEADADVWRQRNFDAYYYAYQVFDKWGALAPGRMEAATRIANEEAGALASGPGAAERCAAFRSRVVDGDEDLTRLDGDLVTRLRRYARQFTPS